mgnify:CR=1 FL=1|tara:strand:+ start:99 stop:938 length:840 start_codon:yes stop_codon:yes gene_type:complete
MGWGDYLMTSGHVRRIKKNNPQIQVLINSPFNTTQFYKSIFYNNPYITHEENFKKNISSVKINRVESGKIDKEKNIIFWHNERVSEVGDLYPTIEEIKFAEEFINQAKNDWVAKNKKRPKAIVYISDTSKSISFSKDNKKDIYNHSVNKEWGKNKWDQFINLIKNDYLIVKSAQSKVNELSDVYSVVCDFRSVKSIMDKSDFFVGNEGGLSHLWATTRKKGIVFFGHWIPPYLTGYSFHINISVNDNKHCGSLKICKDCINFYKNLSPEFIKFHLDSNT